MCIRDRTKWIGGSGNAVGGAIIDGGNFDWGVTGADGNSKYPTLAENYEPFHGINFWEEFGPSALSMRIRAESMRDFGAALSPGNAFLLLQGLESLSLTAHPVAYPVTLFVLIAIQTFALVISTLHLGRPHRFYRAFNNLRYSPVSREVAAVAVFYNLLGLYTVVTGLPELFTWLPEEVVLFVRDASGWLAVIAGPVSLYFMQRIYRIPARPFWDHWQVLTSFYGSMLTLGPLLTALAFLPVLVFQGVDYTPLMQALALPMLVGLMVEAFGLWKHSRYLQSGVGEGLSLIHI